MEAYGAGGEGGTDDPFLTTWTWKVKAREVSCPFPFVAAINNSCSQRCSFCCITPCRQPYLEDLALSCTYTGMREFYCTTWERVKLLWQWNKVQMAPKGCHSPSGAFCTPAWKRPWRHAYLLATPWRAGGALSLAGFQRKCQNVVENLLQMDQCWNKQFPKVLNMV